MTILSLPGSFINSSLRALIKRLELYFKEQLTHFYLDKYL